MEYTSTTRRAVTPQRSDRPGTSTSRSARPPHRHTGHLDGKAAVRPGGTLAAERLLHSTTPARAPATYPALLRPSDLTTAEHEAAAVRDVTGTRPTSLSLWSTAVRAEVLIAQGRYEEAAAHLARPAPDPGWGWSGVPRRHRRSRRCPPLGWAPPVPMRHVAEIRIASPGRSVLVSRSPVPVPT
ncbi:hypothetical protein [Streptomyces sp. NPDC000410]|uniref:hypothetical protein n=1 Tax=Streptomyces sp. NPDC000410 TaxID=3154254 RepID=UPI0033324FCD